jgi:hypothetical protein
MPGRGRNQPKKAMRVREQAVVYLAERDRDLLERLAEETGLSRTELFRRGLRRLAEELLTEQKPGSSLDFLIDSAGESELPPDVSERHDEYLYGGGYERMKNERARSD